MGCKDFCHRTESHLFPFSLAGFEIEKNKTSRSLDSAFHYTNRYTLYNAQDQIPNVNYSRQIP